MATHRAAPRAPYSARKSTGPAPLSWSLALGCSALLAAALSTQLLMQPFVWRHFSADAILLAWLELAGRRLAVAVPIALAVAAASRAPARSTIARSALLVAAILVGALAGEATLTFVADGPGDGGPDPLAMLARAGTWSMLALSIASLYYLWRRSSTIRAAAQSEELQRSRGERELAQVQLQVLRSQIEPHFLFNTLATLRRLHETEPQRGARLLAHFLDYLQSTLPERHQGQGTLGQELELVRAYLGMIEVRVASRLRVVIDVPASLAAFEFPPLALATLVENAVKHGIGPAPEGGTITVHGRRLDATRLEVSVADTGVGFSGSGGSGIGLANIRSRLQTLYASAGTLTLAANAPRGVRAAICLPCREGPAS